MQESDMRWGAVGARPQVVQFHRHDRDTTRSHVGLLNMTASGGDEDSLALLSLASVEKLDVDDVGSMGARLSTVN